MLKYGLIKYNHSRLEGALKPPRFEPRRIWTVKEAKAHLSKFLRLAEEEGPQHIGRRKTFVVVPTGERHVARPARKPMGQWLVENIPRGVNLDLLWRPSGFLRKGQAYRSSRSRRQAMQ